MRGVRAPVLSPPTPPPVVRDPAPVTRARQIEDQLSPDERIAARAKIIPFTSYYTPFNATENPISENLIWVSNGTNRTRIRTTGGIAIGTQSGSGGFDDSYARMSGPWAPDVETIITIFKGASSGIEEIEALFRFNDTPGSGIVTGYEMNLAQDGQYFNCYAWQGAIAGTDFRQIGGAAVSGGVHDGDLIRCRCVGTSLTAEINYNDGAGWHAVFSLTDSQYSSGTPGFGAYREAASAASTEFGAKDIYMRVVL